jgi:hypothetical protein
MYITKFERNYKNELVYQFRNVFPKSMTSIPVSYGSAELLKVNVTFNYDRYVVNPGTYSGSKSNAKPIQKLSDDKSNPSDTSVDPPVGEIFPPAGAGTLRESNRINTEFGALGNFIIT